MRTKRNGESCRASKKNDCDGLVEFQYHHSKRDEFINGTLFHFMYSTFIAGHHDQILPSSSSSSAVSTSSASSTPSAGAPEPEPESALVPGGNNWGVSSCTDSTDCARLQALFVAGLRNQLPEGGKLKFMASTAWVYPTLGLAALLFTVLYFNSTTMDGSTGMMHKTWLVILHTGILVTALVHMAHMESCAARWRIASTGTVLRCTVISVLSSVCIVMSALLSAAAYKTLTDNMMANFL